MLKRLSRFALALTVVALCSVGIAYAYAEFKFVNSNNGAAMTSNSNKLDCLRTLMMSVNAGIPNAFDCSSDTCYQHNTSFVKGRIYSCFDTGAMVGGHPARRCKVDGLYSSWRTVDYSQGVNQCYVCPQGWYTGSGSCNIDGFGNPLMNAFWQVGGSFDQIVKVFP